MKREPQISDGVLDSVARKHGEPIDEPEYCGGPILYAAMDIMSIYEELIDRGTLRVVEEVEFKANTYDCSLTCTGCKEGFADYLMEELEHVNYCPGCGGKIKQA